MERLVQMIRKDIPQEEWDAMFAVNMDGGPICSDPCKCEPPHDGPCPCGNYGGKE